MIKRGGAVKLYQLMQPIYIEFVESRKIQVSAPSLRHLRKNYMLCNRR